MPDDLAALARQCAAASGTTLKSVIEEALRRELARRERPIEWHAEARFAFGEGGPTPWAQSASWPDLREAAMER